MAGDLWSKPGPQRIIWEPQPRQAEAISCPAFELFFGGAKGGGKSDFLIGDFLSDYEEWGEAWKGIVFRRTYKELDEFLTRTKQVIGQIPGAQWLAGGDKYMWRVPAPNARFPGFATLRLRVFDRIEDFGNYNGHQYPWMAWDELTEHPEEAGYLLSTSLCRSADGAPCRIRATGNPGRPGHVWVKARFIDPAPPYHIITDQQSGMTRAFIPSRLEDNRKLMENDPDYEKRLLLQPAHLIKALRYGDWSVISGQVLSEFSEDRHVVKTQVLGEGWYKFAAMDWGYAKPFSIGWYAVNDDGRCVRYKEWYGCTGKRNEGLRMSSQEVAEKAWEMSVFEGVETLVADPSMWNTDDEVAAKITAFQDAGFNCIKAVNDRRNGLQKLHDRMKTVGVDGRPMFLVMRNCTQWIITVPMLTADPRDPEDIDTRLEDHAYDETRYALMSGFLEDPRALRVRPALSTREIEKTSRKKASIYEELRTGI